MSQQRSSSLPERGAAAQRESEIRARPHAKITLIRHGEPQWLPDGGPSVSDPELTPFGVCQAKATARALAGRAFDALYVSPYRRSQQTAAAVGEAIGVEPVTIDGLAEVGVALDGYSGEEVDRYFVAGSKRPLREHWEGWPGAESFHAFHGRITEATTEILNRHSCQSYREHDFTVWELPEKKPSIAIVAHGGTNSVILTHLLDIRPVPWEWLRFETGLASFSTAHARRIGPKGYVWSLQSFNCEAHLCEAGLR
jgi:probable phosphoglycerate mutase